MVRVFSGESFVMVRQVVESLVDDIDGSGAAETVRFSFGSGTYEIDLSARNVSALRTELAPFVQAARRIEGKASKRDPKVKRGQSAIRDWAASANNPAAIRQWAATRGDAVGKTGRIPARVVEAYRSRSGLAAAPTS